MKPSILFLQRLSFCWALCLLALFYATQLQSEPVKSIPVPFTEAAAMRLLYGNYDKQTGSVLSHVKIPSRVEGIFPSSIAGPWRVFPYVEGGRNKCMLITATPLKQEATSKDTLTSHADGELVGAAVFRQDGNRYTLEASNLFLQFMGHWATPSSQMRMRIHNTSRSSSKQDLYIMLLYFMMALPIRASRMTCKYILSP